MINRLLVITTFDSQLKTASYIAEYFRDNSWEVKIRIPKVSENQLSSSQLKNFSSFSEFDFCSSSIPDVIRDIQLFGVVLIVMDGVYTQKILSETFLQVRDNMWDARPILVTGFVGVGLFDTTVGYQRRLCSDLLFVNSRKDYQDCVSVAKAFNLSGDNVFISGMPFVGDINKNFSVPKHIDTVLFAGQPDVPRRIIDRIYLLEKMIEYATRFPERKILFKPRHRPNEVSLHKTKFHYEVLLKSYLKNTDVPKNFSIVYDSMQNLLEDSQLLITVSSTAAVEALAKSCHVAVISDLGISESFGTNFFLGSGMLTTFNKLYKEEYTLPEKEWIDKNVQCDGNASKIIFEKVLDLQRRQRSEGLPINISDSLLEVLESQKIRDQRNQILVHNVIRTADFYLKRFFLSRINYKANSECK